MTESFQNNLMGRLRVFWLGKGAGRFCFSLLSWCYGFGHLYFFALPVIFCFLGYPVGEWGTIPFAYTFVLTYISLQMSRCFSKRCLSRHGTITSLDDHVGITFRKFKKDQSF